MQQLRVRQFTIYILDNSLVAKCILYIPPHLFHVYALYFETRQFNFANEQTAKMSKLNC